MMDTERTARTGNGFSLVEVLVAITIMMVVLVSLAGGSAAVARMSNGSGDRIQRSASRDDFASALSTMPWGQLPSGTSCESFTGEFPYERCVTVTDVSAREKQLQIIVTPDNHRISPDTVIIERAMALGSNPLNTN